MPVDVPTLQSYKGWFAFSLDQKHPSLVPNQAPAPKAKAIPAAPPGSRGVPLGESQWGKRGIKQLQIYG